ncbi:hypothetical protein BH23CHL8_BH23CHL8_23680 [soil metagenome]
MTPDRMLVEGVCRLRGAGDNGRRGSHSGLITLDLRPKAFVDALLGSRLADTRAELLALVEQGAQPRDLYLGVLSPALEEVGHRWQMGLATVAQEHLATAIVSSLMASLAARLDESPPVGGRIVLASTEGELHAVGIRMMADFLEGDGWDVRFLGADTPRAELLGFVVDVRPEVVGLSTALTTHLAAAREAVADVHALDAAPVVLVGGQAYASDPGAWARVGADAYAADAGEASRLLRARYARV